ncbi:multisubunit potassium/proton antiporter, PhaD subunit [Rhizobium sp. RU20A]|uniref:monovalent cation/H+ antiporter subunit D n=1 Tax=Rhizobium sp. RU20A TaxID=1907412 RepID=UPI000955E660|nr:monovalent cation/H+ antiporter subunit D [Rhizobium sp. RU20A]SIQ99148.1 multisubunit potassium/proton antiporter, PhaD subunit [Rhizobium sp. RU20A]
MPNHLITLPILLPLIVAAAMIPISERSRILKGLLGVSTTFVVFIISVVLMRQAAEADAVPLVYLLGNWSSAFGIVLVADRLSVLMLFLTSILALAAQVYGMAKWHTAGYHFHSLFLMLVAGLNGAYLTGDIFNLFVFFEMLLAASYGLLLHGSGPQRVRAGLHYIAINLAASSLFLVGIALIYGAAGTLNMAGIALAFREAEPANRLLLEAGATAIGITFLIKAGMWPLCFWLPGAYSVATPPAAAIFAILSKVGIYILLRLSVLVFGPGSGASAGFGQALLFYGGLATIAFGMIGVLASQAMGRLASYCVLVSSGTLLAAIGLGKPEVIGGALFYLVSSTLTLAALFLLIELVERGRDAGADVLAVTMEAYGDAEDEEVEQEVGVAIPATIAVLGFCFSACGILIAGLPPLSGFLAKFAMLSGVIGGNPGAVTAAQWSFVALLIVSGLAAMIAMSRAGIRTFWASLEGTVPRVMVVEILPVIMLLGICVLFSIRAASAIAYMDDTADALMEPARYIEAVRGAVTVPPAEQVIGAKPVAEGG